MHQFLIKMDDRNAIDGENYEYIIRILGQIDWEERRTNIMRPTRTVVDAYDPSLKLLVDKLGQFYMYACAEFT